MELAKIIKAKRLQYGMTMKQLADRVGVAEATVSRWESGYTEKMKIDTAGKVADALHLSPLMFLGYDVSEEETVKIPIVGRVVAGSPILAEENIEGMVEISKKQDVGTVFGLRVRGKSMEPNIRENDLLIVRQQSDVESGDIAIVMINGDEATVKQVKKSKDGITLIGFNIAVYSPHFYSNKEIEELPVRIAGKVIESRHEW